MTNQSTLQLSPSNDNSAADRLTEAFPELPQLTRPFGNRIVVQMRLPRTQTKSGIQLVADSVENLYRNEQTAKVVSIGSGAFHFPTSGEAWTDKGYSFKVGDYVRVPVQGGDNYWVALNDGKDTKVLFKTFKDYEIIALIEGDPLEVKTVIAYF